MNSFPDLAVALCFRALKFVFLIGDPDQLSPHVVSFVRFVVAVMYVLQKDKVAAKLGLDVSLPAMFCRVRPWFALDTQCRMHPDIAQHIRNFYPGINMKDDYTPGDWHVSLAILRF